MMSCLSNPSLPGTFSSGSSTNSQRRSPLDLESPRVDSLISSLLQAVIGEPRGNSIDQLVSANETQAVVRHQDFRELRDESCIISHRRACVSNIRHTSSVIRSNTPSPPLVRHSCSPPVSSSLYCEMHRDTQRFYCKTCTLIICGESGIREHRSHGIVYLSDAIESAGVMATQVLGDARVGIATIREELEVVEITLEGVEVKARQATSEVRTAVRILASMLEERERELLARVERVRLMQGATLRARAEDLRTALVRLSRTVERLSEALDRKSTINPIDLLQIKESAAAEVIHVQQVQNRPPPKEEDWISFTGLDASILHAITSMGSMMMATPGYVGDCRALRGRAEAAEEAGDNAPSGSTSAIVPRGRPVLGNPYFVNLNNGQGFNPMRLIPVAVWGSEGDSDGEVCRPWGVCCDKDGHIIVADRSNNRIQIFLQDGTFVRKFGSQGSGPGQFDRPAGVAIDTLGNIVIADKDNHRIQIFTVEGVYLLSFGEKGVRNGQFNYPWDVAVNTVGQIAISDTRNHRVQLFDSEGNFLRKYGFEGCAGLWKHFDSPRGVAFSPQGCVVVTDFNNHRLVVIDPDFVNARFLGGEGTGLKQFLRPQGVVIDDEGHIVVADSRNHRIQVFEPAGGLLAKIGSFGKAFGELDRPSGVALTPDGRIVVVDFGNSRIQVF